jgi:hypothetical protein
MPPNIGGGEVYKGGYFILHVDPLAFCPSPIQGSLLEGQLLLSTLDACIFSLANRTTGHEDWNMA